LLKGFKKVSVPFCLRGIFRGFRRAVAEKGVKKVGRLLKARPKRVRRNIYLSGGALTWKSLVGAKVPAKWRVHEKKPHQKRIYGPLERKMTGRIAGD